MPDRRSIANRPEYAQKPRPLTARPEDSVREAVRQMSRHNYGCVVVVDAGDRPIGLMTERDVMKRLIDADRDPATTTVGEIMTANPRSARRDDLVVDWLRIMSNERFRRLPVVDEDGRLESIFTQGDFVSYTWPELGRDAPAPARSIGGFDWRPVAAVGGVVGVYTLLMALIFNVA
ncbi:cyclic nucleotide-binding/CBS domain-containing protein [Roseobacter sp. HKCCA0434]|uniref:CBS domain-containing protein n=1 Tax=Roseobacter sp. HKCCA0434 TaxID=3079297 RepID=UPI0029059E3F|nr:CBS domain-containing protein [Roseobacter sp. HKCCA0434]